MSTLLTKADHWGLFNDPFFSDVFNVFNNKIGYPYDIFTRENVVYIEVPLAGYYKNNIKIEVDNNILRLNVKSPESEGDDTICRYIHKGVSKKTLSFGWNLPENVDKGAIASKFDNGLLRIIVPFKEKEKVTKQIEIQ